MSGGAKELWGSRYLARAVEQWAGWSNAPQVVTALNLDMIGSGRSDTLAVAGLQELDWPTPPAWIAAAHPELGLTVVDSGTLFVGANDGMLQAFTAKDGSERFAYVPACIDFAALGTLSDPKYGPAHR